MTTDVLTPSDRHFDSTELRGITSRLGFQHFHKSRYPVYSPLFFSLFFSSYFSNSRHRDEIERIERKGRTDDGLDYRRCVSNSTRHLKTKWTGLARWLGQSSTVAIGSKIISRMKKRLHAPLTFYEGYIRTRYG